MKNYSPKTVTYVGDVGIDEYHLLDGSVKTLFGGIASNGAVHAKKKSNDHIRLISVVGDDEAGQEAQKVASNQGIETNIQIKHGKTPKQMITLEAGGERKFVGYEPGVLSGFVLTNEQKEKVRDSNIVVTCLFAGIESLCDSVLDTPHKGKTAVDFTDLADFNKDISVVTDRINALDIAFFGLVKGKDDGLCEALQKIASDNNKLFVVTLGKAGAYAYDGSDIYYQSATQVAKVVDTTGAGDAFAAAFLSEYIRSKNIKESLKKASLYASTVIGYLGGFRQKRSL